MSGGGNGSQQNAKQVLGLLGAPMGAAPMVNPENPNNPWGPSPHPRNPDGPTPHDPDGNNNNPPTTPGTTGGTTAHAAPPAYFGAMQSGLSYEQIRKILEAQLMQALGQMPTIPAPGKLPAASDPDKLKQRERD